MKSKITFIAIGASLSLLLSVSISFANDMLDKMNRPSTEQTNSSASALASDLTKATADPNNGASELVPQNELSADEQFVRDMRTKMLTVGVEFNTEGLSSEEAVLVARKAYDNYVNSASVQQPIINPATQVPNEYTTEQYALELQLKMRSVGVDVDLTGLSAEDALAKVSKAYGDYINQIQSEQITDSETQNNSSEQSTAQYINAIKEKLAANNMLPDIEGLTQNEALIAIEKALTNYVTQLNANELQRKMRLVALEVDLTGLSPEEALAKALQAYDDFIMQSKQLIIADIQTFTPEVAIAPYIKAMKEKLAAIQVMVDIDGLTQDEALVALEKAIVYNRIVVSK